MSKAIVVLSGGQDSTTCLYMARARHTEVHAITFDYGQTHALEIEAAKKIAAMAEITSHEVIPLSGNVLHSTSPLVDRQAELEEYSDAGQMDRVIGDRVEKTFVPMRNSLFLVIAANRAVKHGCAFIYTGVCQQDNANYPDCTARFIDAIEKAIRLSLGEGPNLRIVTPLMYLSKKETVRVAHDNLDCWKALSYSHTSYDGLYPPTGMNHANVLRADGFEQADLPDPLVLRAVHESLMELPSTPNYREALVQVEMNRLRPAWTS